MEKKLYRSRTDRMILGVCGGLAKYFGMDVSLMRIITVLLAIATGGFAILVYFIMAIIVPVEGSQKNIPGEVVKENAEDIKNTAQDFGKKVEETFSNKKTEANSEADSQVHARRRNALGIVIIVIGVLVLLSVLNIWHWGFWTIAWPLVLIAIGVLIIVSVSKKKS